MKKYLALIIGSLIIFTACANSSEKNKVGDMPDSVEAAEIKNNNYEEIIKDSEYDNINVSENFKLTVPEYNTLGIYQVIYTDDFDNNYESLFGKYIPDYDPDRIVINNGDNNLKQIQYEDNNTFSFVTSIGGFVVSDKQCLNRVLYGDTIPFIQTNLVDINDMPEYRIGNEKVSLKELVSASNDFISDFIGSADYPNLIKPFAFSTQTIDDGSIAGIMHCRYCYKDMPIFDIQSMHDEYSNGMAILTPPTCTFINGDEVGQFTTICAMRDHKTLQTIDRIISPSGAVDAASQKLSGYSNYELQYEELVYFPTCNENTLGIEPGNGYEPGDVITLTPYWIIYFDTNWWHETFAAINAVTGEVDFVNNAK